MPKPQQLVFFGATAFPEFSEIVRDINQLQPTPKYEITAILDDNVTLHGKEFEGTRVIGPLEVAHQYPDAQFVLGIGSYKARLTRYTILQRLAIPPERYATLIHPMAKVWSSASVGHGCIIFPGACIVAGSVVENFCQILSNSATGVNSRLCEGALVCPLVTITINDVIGYYSHIGTGSAISENVKIGPGAQVALGSVIYKDVPPGILAMGNPTRFLDKVEVHPDLLARWEHDYGPVAVK